ncbi:MAG: thymidylate synthase [Candidatus Paceibacterota bacterium]
MNYHYFIKKDTVDDLMYETFKSCKTGGSIIESTRGENKKIKELVDAKLVLTNPLSRLSISGTRSTPYSAIGELFWYLSGSNELEFIEYYISLYRKESEDNETVTGAYGPRIMGVESINQLENIISLLRRREASKKAVIQIYEKKDLDEHIKKKHNSVPCTLTLQFLVRNSKVDMIVNMRSNDIIYGLPHDIFAFTMMQEIIARSIDKELGVYIHNVGSLHYYTEMEAIINDYMYEGYHSTLLGEMPRMPSNTYHILPKLLDTEAQIRKGLNVDLDKLNLDDYWHDILLLLKCFKHFNLREKESFFREKEKFQIELFKKLTDIKTHILSQ